MNYFIGCVCGGCAIKYNLMNMYRITIPEVNVPYTFVCKNCYDYYIFQYDTCRDI